MSNWQTDFPKTQFEIKRFSGMAIRTVANYIFDKLETTVSPLLKGMLGSQGCIWAIKSTVKFSEAPLTHCAKLCGAM